MPMKKVLEHIIAGIGIIIYASIILGIALAVILFWH